jgi:hypothetical protein
MPDPDNMKDEFQRLEYEQRYNRSQFIPADLVCRILRKEVLYHVPRDDTKRNLSTHLERWMDQRPVWNTVRPAFAALANNPSYSRMRVCLENCRLKLDTRWRMHADVEIPAPLELKDLFMLLMGTVHIPWSPETIQLILSTGLMDRADLVLIGRDTYKIELWGDAQWCKILTDLASVIERDEDTQTILEQICTSVEGYSRQKLDERLERLKKEETHLQVYAAVTLATHREQQHASPDTPVLDTSPDTPVLDTTPDTPEVDTTLKSFMHRLLELSI